MLKLSLLKPRYESYVRDISIVFLLILPLTICNAMSIFFGHFLNWLSYPDAAKEFFYFSNLLISIYPTALCLILTYYLSGKHSVSPLVVVPYALLMYFSLSITNGLVAGNGLPNNPLLALLSAMITTAACVSFRLYPLDPSKINFVSSLYKQVAHFFAFLLMTVGLSALLEKFIELMAVYRGNFDIDPLTFSGGLIYQFTLGLLGAIGINGHNFLFRAKQQLFDDTQANLAAWETGQASLNVLGQGFYDAFLQIGGSGNSLSLLLCILLFSKDKRHLSLALSAIPLVIFNINELLLFGLPIIFNPTLIVPFVLTPLVAFVVVYAVMSWGWVAPVSTIVDWMTPALFSGYIATNNSMEGVILQVVVIVLGIMIYRPFYLHYAGNSAPHTHGVFRQQELEKNTLQSFLGDVNQAMGNTISKYDVSRRVSKMLNRGEFVMYYQPQVHLQQGRQVAFESLLRYRDERGNILPPTFIDDFRELGAMRQLDDMVLDLVLMDMKTMPLERGYKVGVNVSVETVSDANYVHYVAERLAHYSIAADALEIEITEEAILENHTQVARNIDALQAMGVKVAIDDFGSGYASFPHLLKFNWVFVIV